MTQDIKLKDVNRPVIERYVSRPRSERTLKDLDEIFYESSGTKKFEDDHERLAFRERWLGRYLLHHPAQAFLAVSDSGGEMEKVVGYLVGSLDDPAVNPAYSDLGYFQLFAHLTAKYPAQLHINVAIAWRGFGVGRDLVQTFVEDLRTSEVSGVHVITSEGMRNIHFYGACGFKEVGSCIWNDRKLVMLGFRI